MRHRAPPAPPTEEDADIWVRNFHRWPAGTRWLMFADYGVCDARDAAVMLYLGTLTGTMPARLCQLYLTLPEHGHAFELRPDDIS